MLATGEEIRSTGRYFPPVHMLDEALDQKPTHPPGGTITFTMAAKTDSS